MIKRILQSDLFVNRYYILGLAFQKGLPFLVIPLIVSQLGKGVYSNFALICYSVQMLSMFFALGTPSSIVVFWNNYENKNIYLGMQIALMTIATICFLLGLVFYHHALTLVTGLEHVNFLMTILIIVFVFAYNFNGIEISVLRAMFLSKQYFYSVVLSSIVFLLLILLLGKFSGGLSSLLFIYILSLVLQGVGACFFSRIIPSFNFRHSEFLMFSRKILKYSIPIMLHTVIAATTITLDKWFVRAHFNKDIFAQYIFNFQFSYVINIISVVVGMYNLPIFCKYISERNTVALSKSILINYLLAIACSCAAVIVSWSYAHLTGIHLSYGFLVLSTAFLFTNLYAVNVSLFEAYRFSHGLLMLIVVPIIAFWIIFYYSVSAKKIEFVYLDFLLYNIVIFCLSYAILYLKKNKFF